jgi:peptidoglycan/LPS O-acetylase OafA/YrhL
MSTNVPPRTRFAGLDGLRAIAVTLVVVYHLFPQSWAHSGFVGVDVFFVISGFLITALLLRERGKTGRIRLRSFWIRRARRLLPALGLMLTACATLAWVIGGDVLLDLGRQVLGAATFSYNWVSIAAGGDYFGTGQPELFRNLWSLAVEEQFYALWPLLLPALLRVPGRWLRGGIAVAAAGASAGWAAALVLSGAGLTRAYFGTESHAFGLLLGVALAIAFQSVLDAPREWMRHRPARVIATVVGAAALGGVVGVAALPASDGVLRFPGALLAASALSAVIVAAAAWPGSPLGRALDMAPLRFVGERSYALYLWHWPVLVLLTAATGSSAAAGEPSPGLGLAALALTLLAAEVSRRLVELPVRRLGFRRVALRPWVSLAGSARGRVRVLGALVASVVLLGGTTAAIAAAPEVSSGEAAVDAGARALREQSSSHSAAADGTDAAGSMGAEAAPMPSVVDSPPVAGDQITAVGDSVMLASAPALIDRFPGISVDASVSRSMYAAPGILRSLADTGQLRPYVVVALGTNGAISTESLDDIRRTLGPDRHLILVTAFAPRSWIDGVNAELTRYARAHHDVEVADWAGAIGNRVDLLAGDQIHPGEAGGELFADTVEEALRDAQESDAELHDIVETLTDPTADR